MVAGEDAPNFSTLVVVNLVAGCVCLAQAREAEFEAEQQRIHREKEMETARLRALQEKAQDHQAEQVPHRPKRHLSSLWPCLHISECSSLETEVCLP